MQGVVAWLGDTGWTGHCTIEEGDYIFQPYLAAGDSSEVAEKTLGLLPEGNRDILLHDFILLNEAANDKHLDEIFHGIRDCPW